MLVEWKVDSRWIVCHVEIQEDIRKESQGIYRDRCTYLSKDTAKRNRHSSHYENVTKFFNRLERAATFCFVDFMAKLWNWRNSYLRIYKMSCAILQSDGSFSNSWQRAWDFETHKSILRLHACTIHFPIFVSGQCLINHARFDALATTIYIHHRWKK